MHDAVELCMSLAALLLNYQRSLDALLRDDTESLPYALDSLHEILVTLSNLILKGQIDYAPLQLQVGFPSPNAVPLIFICMTSFFLSSSIVFSFDLHESCMKCSPSHAHCAFP